MVETYTIKHRGQLNEYLDEVMIYTSRGMYITLIDGKSYNDNLSDEYKAHLSEFKSKVRKLFTSEFVECSFATLCEVVDKLAFQEDGYLIMHIDENCLEAYVMGSTQIKLITDGKISSLPNGVYRIKEEDSLILGTNYFFSLVNDEGVLVDALLSGTCKVWSKYLINRISDNTYFECCNLSCCTVRYRE